MSRNEGMKKFWLKKGRRDAQEEEEELLVFGYASKLYENDEKAECIAEERHLIAWPGDAELLIDRRLDEKQILERFSQVRQIWAPTKEEGNENQCILAKFASESIALLAVPRWGNNDWYEYLYDCRLYLSNLEPFEREQGCQERNGGSEGENEEEHCPTEALEEEMCDEERYRDLHECIQREEEEKEQRRRAEIGFSYDDEAAKAESSSSEEEIEEPFCPPEGIKLPVGMNLPETMKLNAVIERTATFVVAQGAQMEIVIKAKQRGSLDQFGFLEFDHPLNAYYKYISKLIREKKYFPKPHIPKRRPKPKKLLRLQREEEERKRVELEKNTIDKPTTSSSLASIAEAHGSETEVDSDSDGEGHYLHPLLMGGNSTRANSRSQSPIIGPKTKAEHEESITPPPPPKIDYDLTKANDMYSSLFKNLAELRPAKTITAIGGSPREAAENVEENVAQKDDYAEWYMNFYGEQPPSAVPPAVLPPPPDLAPSVNCAAEYVAKHGCQAEYLLAERSDLGMEFTKKSSPYYSYYQSRVRYFQWVHAVAAHNSAQEPSSSNAEPAKQDLDGPDDDIKSEKAVDNGEEGDPAQSLDASEDVSLQEGEQTTAFKVPISESILQAPPPPSPVTYMNRKMRRRGFHDPPAAAESRCAAEVGLVEPDVHLAKTQSSPALLVGGSSTERQAVTTDLKKTTIGPISFSLTTPKSDDQIQPSASAVALGAYDDDDDANEPSGKPLDVPAGVVTAVPPPGLTIPPPPAAPVPLASGQLALEGSAELQSERKEKARLFMERILNEKRAAKLKAQNEEKMKNSAVREGTENRSGAKETNSNLASSASVSTKEKAEKATKGCRQIVLSTTEIDKLINSQIDKVLGDSNKKREAEKSGSSRHRSSKGKKKKKKAFESEEEGEISSDSSQGKKRKRHRERSASRDSDDMKRRKSSKKKRHHRSRSRSVRDRRKHGSRSGSRKGKRSRQ